MDLKQDLDALINLLDAGGPTTEGAYTQSVRLLDLLHAQAKTACWLAREKSAEVALEIARRGIASPELATLYAAAEEDRERYHRQGLLVLEVGSRLRDLWEARKAVQAQERNLLACRGEAQNAARLLADVLTGGGVSASNPHAEDALPYLSADGKA